MQQNAELTTPDLFGTEIHTSMHNGNPVFCVADIGVILGVTNPHALVRNVPERHKLTVQLVRAGQSREMWCVTEAGLYRILLRSHSPVAERFTDWVTEEVLPTIRRQGFYADPNLMLRTKEYLLMREITNPSDGFGHTCMAVCRRLGVTPERHRKRGHAFPARVLDEAARGKPAGRGPLVRGEVADVFVFIRDRVE